MNQTNTGHCCPLKRGNTQPAFYLVYNINIVKITVRQIYKYQGFN